MNMDGEAVLLVLLLLSSLIVLLSPAIIALARRKGLSRDDGTRPWAPAVSLLVPLAPREEHLAGNVRSYLAQTGLRDYEVILVAEDPDDPAAVKVRELLIGYPCVESSLVFSGSPRGRLAKMHNLAVGLTRCRYDLVVLVDSDVKLSGPTHLRDVTRPLLHREIGLVTASPVYRSPRTPGGLLMSAMINSDLRTYFAWLYVMNALNVANGALLATKQSVLEAIGGLEDLQHQLLNDTMLARKVRGAGMQVVLWPEPVVVPAPSLSIVGWWRQVMRWHVGMRTVLPRGEYILYGCLRSGLFLGLLLFLLLDSSPYRAVYLLAPALARVLSFSLQALFWLRDPRSAVQVPVILVLDLLSPFIWIVSWLENTVWWRGRSYRIRRGGLAEEIGRV